jgi:Tol biopolymer transport system component
VPRFDGDQPQITTPRWSPVGDRIAFLKATFGGGGFLLTADAGTGEVTAPPEPLFADFGYAWSPDGRRIAWAGGRSDVSPVDVGVYTVGETSKPVARDTNATAVSYSTDGRSVVFANADATGDAFADIPFGLRVGGIYSVSPGERPVSLYGGADAYADVQVIADGAVAVAVWSADQRRKDIAIIENGTRRDVAETPGDAPAPVWTVAGTEPAVAYVGAGTDRPLLTKREGGAPQTIDSGADAYAWGRT